MPITRAKAVALLNKGEMQLYDDSRANAIRGFDAGQINSRITRARSARDRARDLVQRQKLASRDRTGNKRGKSGLANQRSKDKAEIMADILKRFEAQLREAEKNDGQASAGAEAKARRQPGKAAGRKADRAAARREVARKATGKAAKKKTAAAKGSTAKTASKAASRSAAKTAGKSGGKSGGKSNRQAAARDGAGPGKGAGKVAKTAKAGKTAKTAAKKTTKKTTKKTAKRGRKAAERAITPKKALKNTRALLEARQEEARQPKAWESPTKRRGQITGDGYQTGAAARRAEHLHAAQSRIPAIQGSISTRGRINQGKRDNRGSGSDAE